VMKPSKFIDFAALRQSEPNPETKIINHKRWEYYQKYYHGKSLRKKPGWISFEEYLRTNLKPPGYSILTNQEKDKKALINEIREVELK